MKFSIVVLSAAFIAGMPSQIQAGVNRNKPVVSVRVLDRWASEAANDPAYCFVQRTHGVRTPLRVYYRVGGSAINGVDYDNVAHSVVIPAGRQGVLLRIQPVDDTLAEENEAVTIRLAHPTAPARSPYRIGAHSAATVTIIDDDLDMPAELTILTTDVGTVVHWPELGGYQAVEYAELHSHYSRTTEINREFRRAFLEFEIPTFNRHILSATLNLSDNSATGPSLPVVQHELSYYQADSVVEVSDYTNDVTSLATFTTDGSVSSEAIGINIMHLMPQFLGGKLGFRINVAGDPEHHEYGGFGAAFQTIHHDPPPRITILSTERPWIAITSPGDHAAIAAGANIPIRALTLDQDGFTSTVEFWANGEKIGEHTLEAPMYEVVQYFSMVWSNVPPGIYVITATTVDDWGARATSRPVTIFVGQCDHEIVLAPQAVGRINFWPEIPPPDQYTFFNDLASGYHKSTEHNRRYRRGFIEYQVPQVSAGIVSATLMLRGSPSATSYPFPPDTHELWAYPSDLTVNVEDYNREGVLVGTFITDLNVPDEMISVDVTRLITEFQGFNLGLRIKLAVDPAFNEMHVSMGEGFYTNPEIIIVTCK